MIESQAGTCVEAGYIKLRLQVLVAEHHGKNDNDLKCSTASVLNLLRVLMMGKTSNIVFVRFSHSECFCTYHYLPEGESLFLLCPSREVDETKDWISEKDAALNNDNYGHDLASVQALQRKHEGLERDLAALGEKVRSVAVWGVLSGLDVPWNFIFYGLRLAYT